MAEKTSDVSTDSDLNRAKLKCRKYARKVPSDDEEESDTNNDKVAEMFIPLRKTSQVIHGSKKNSISTSASFSKQTYNRQQNTLTILGDDQEKSNGINDKVTEIYFLFSKSSQVTYSNKKNITTSVSSSKQTCDRQRSITPARETQKTSEENEAIKKLVTDISNSQSITENMMLYDSDKNNNQHSSESKNEIISQIRELQEKQENINISSHINARSKQDTISKQHCNSCKSKQINFFVNFFVNVNFNITIELHSLL